MTATSEGREREFVLLGLAVLIAIVWATATMVQVIFPTHAVPTEVHFVMMSVAAFFFGGSVFTAIRHNGHGANGERKRQLDESVRQVKADADFEHHYRVHQTKVDDDA